MEHNKITSLEEHKAKKNKSPDNITPFIPRTAPTENEIFVENAKNLPPSHFMKFIEGLDHGLDKTLANISPEQTLELIERFTDMALRSQSYYQDRNSD
jgi:hypothetical protein